MLLGPDQAHLAAAAERADELLVGQEVELLLDLALDVDVARVAEEVDEPGLADVAVDDLGGDGEVAEEPGELAFEPGASASRSMMNCSSVLNAPPPVASVPYRPSTACHHSVWGTVEWSVTGGVIRRVVRGTSVRSR